MLPKPLFVFILVTILFYLNPGMPHSFTPKPIKILIVDDHGLFNDGLKAMLIRESTIEVVGQVYHSKDAFYEVNRLNPDLLLMDFNMPGTNGLEMTQQLLQHFPALKILILSMYSEVRYIEDFRKAGARGYLLKTVNVVELLSAIRAVMAGKTYFDPKILQTKVPGSHAEDSFLKRFRLTSREIEVMRYIRQGLSTQQIADTVHVSMYTIETHRRNIHFKLKVKSVAELIRFMDSNEI
jgi:DNA-binding NarL/FixJ family response regulator